MLINLILVSLKFTILFEFQSPINQSIDIGLEILRKYLLHSNVDIIQILCNFSIIP